MASIEAQSQNGQVRLAKRWSTYAVGGDQALPYLISKELPIERECLRRENWMSRRITCRVEGKAAQTKFAITKRIVFFVEITQMTERMCMKKNLHTEQHSGCKQSEGTFSNQTL